MYRPRSHFPDDYPFPHSPPQQHQIASSTQPPILSQPSHAYTANAVDGAILTTTTKKLIIALTLLSVPFPKALDTSPLSTIYPQPNDEDNNSSSSNSCHPVRMRRLSRLEIADVIRVAYLRSYISYQDPSHESRPGSHSDSVVSLQSRAVHRLSILSRIAFANTASYIAKVGPEVEARRAEWMRYAAFLTSVWWRETEWQARGQRGVFEVGPEVQMPDS